MFRNARTFTARNRRGGAVTLELLVVLPILLFLLLAIFVFSLLESNRHRVIHASAQGSRVASQGGSVKDVDVAVRQALGSPQLAKHAKIETVLGKRTGQPVLVKVQIPAIKVVPDLLRFVGFSIRNISLVGQTVHRKE